MPLTNELKELRHLMNINQDAASFYDSAAHEVESPHLKQTFIHLKELHRTVIEHLQSHIATQINAEAKGTFSGQASQFWGELMAKISHDVDETLVRHLEEAEDRCLHSMQEATNNPEIRPSTKAILRSELQALRKSHDYMRALKINIKAA